MIPILLDLDFSDISGPLAQFQAKKFDKKGLFEVVDSINTIESPVPDERVRSLFDALWPQLADSIDSVPHKTEESKQTRPQPEVLEELVEGVRSFDSRLREMETLLSEGNPRSRKRRSRMHPMMFEDISEVLSESGDDLASLLILASFIREDLPWFSEILTETYREMRSGGSRSIPRCADRLQRMSRMFMRGPFIEDLGINSKDVQMMMMEMPMWIDRITHRAMSRRSKESIKLNEVGVDDEV